MTNDPMALSEAERNHIVAALAFLATHHMEQREQFARAVGIPMTGSARWLLAVAAHHAEQLHQIGELLTRFGGRNAWPRPTDD